MMKKLLLALLLVTFSLAAWAQTQLKIITLQHRFAQDLVPVVQPLLGPDGNASAIDNQLLVRASPERLQAIEQLVASMDTERKNLRITVSHSNVQQGRQQNLGVDGSARVGNGRVVIRNGRRMPAEEDDVNVDIRQRDFYSSQSGSEFVTVADGQRAFIRVGQRVPYTQQWVLLTQRYLSVQRSTEFQDITTGFAVRPRSINGQVELEITPRIAQLNSAGYIDFEELSTVVRVSPGEWFDLGGTMQGKDDVSRAILSSASDYGSGNSALQIRVDE